MSVTYYDVNAQEFFSSTNEVDASELYDSFLAVLKPGAHILDAGCGSGRDTLAFTNAGYRVTAFDASRSLAELASQFTGQKIQVVEFSRFQSEVLFEAIWACASLLHVLPQELPDVFSHLASFLKPEGIFYCSFKLGSGVVERGGRKFTNADEKFLGEMIEGTGLKVKSTWISSDIRTDRDEEKWLNALLFKAFP